MQLKGFKIDLGKIDNIEMAIKDLGLQLPDLETKLTDIQTKVKSNMDALSGMVHEMDMMEALTKQIGDASVIDRVAKGKKMLAEKLAVCTKIYNRIK
jgi:hypothetical protein